MHPQNWWWNRHRVVRFLWHFKPGYPDMKSTIAVFLLIILSLAAKGQILRGTVLDADTREPIPLVSVFFDGTFVGTSTDDQGKFKLIPGTYITRPLSISAVGYVSHTLKDLQFVKPYTILLARDLYEIGEVSIAGKDVAKKRKAYMRIFRNEFIGMSRYARNCHIVNEEVISFDYRNDRDTIRARAHLPLEIHNNALGYHFFYHLESFEFVKKTESVSYHGSIVFTHDFAWEGSKASLYKRRRRSVYRGSSKEFIRTLWKDGLKSSGYHIKDYHSGETLACKDVVREDESGRKYMSFQGILQVQYYNYYSKLDCLKKEAYIDQDGFFDPAALIWSGKMASQRIADFLPYEYSAGR